MLGEARGRGAAIALGLFDAAVAVTVGVGATAVVTAVAAAGTKRARAARPGLSREKGACTGKTERGERRVAMGESGAVGFGLLVA